MFTELVLCRLKSDVYEGKIPLDTRTVKCYFGNMKINDNKVFCPCFVRVSRPCNEHTDQCQKILKCTEYM